MFLLPLTHPTLLGRYRAPSWFPVLYSNCSPAICFTHGNVSISVLLFQSTPPSPSPTMSTSPFSMSASFFLPCK